mgnify:CR=1 FL=1
MGRVGGPSKLDIFIPLRPLLAYATAALCTVSFVFNACFALTGLLHHRVPTQVNRYALREGCWTIARALRKSGYETALFGKMHFFPVHADHGFDTLRTVEHLTSDRVRAGEQAGRGELLSGARQSPGERGDLPAQPATVEVHHQPRRVRRPRMTRRATG